MSSSWAQINSVSCDRTSVGQYKITWLANEQADSVQINIPDSDKKNWKPIEMKRRTLTSCYIDSSAVINSFLSYNLNHNLTYFNIVYFTKEKKISFPDDLKDTIISPSNVLLQAFYDPCKHSIKLSWNHFNGWPNGYENRSSVYITIDNKDYLISKFGETLFLDNERSLELIPDSFNVEGVDNFKLEINKTYKFQVLIQKFFNNSTRADRCFSNPCEIITTNDVYPTYIEAIGTDARSNNLTKLSFFVDPISQSKHYKLVNPSDPSLYQIKDTIGVGGLMDFFVKNADIQFTYKLLALSNIETCKKTIESNIESNIVLTIPPLVSNDVKLSWCEYKKFNGTLDHYSVYRIRNGDTVVVGTTSNLEFNNSISPDNLPNKQVSEQLSYYVMANEINNPKGQNGKAFSNTETIVVISKPIPPKFFSPNNDGKNDIWEIPNCVSGNYLLIIYDRWTNKVFEGNTYKWNGNYSDGSPAPHGEYLFYFKITDSFGKSTEVKGTFTLLRK